MRNVPGILVLVLSIGIAITGYASQSSEPAAAPAATELAPVEQPPLAASPLEAPAGSELSAVAGVPCGGITCAPGLRCCNPSCNTCTPKGVECTQQSCN